MLPQSRTSWSNGRGVDHSTSVKVEPSASSKHALRVAPISEHRRVGTSGSETMYLRTVASSRLGTRAMTKERKGRPRP
eukprot:6465304-Amphidinium_carterae.1